MSSEGRYTHIIGDLSHLSGETFTQSICNLGIFGTKYIRDIPVDPIVEFTEGSTEIFVITMDQIYA